MREEHFVLHLQLRFLVFGFDVEFDVESVLSSNNFIWSFNCAISIWISEMLFCVLDFSKPLKSYISPVITIIISENGRAILATEYFQLFPFLFEKPLNYLFKSIDWLNYKWTLRHAEIQ